MLCYDMLWYVIIWYVIIWYVTSTYARDLAQGERHARPLLFERGWGGGAEAAYLLSPIPIHIPIPVPIPIPIHIYIHAQLHTYMPVHIHTYIPAYLRHIPVLMHTCIDVDVDTARL